MSSTNEHVIQSGASAPRQPRMLGIGFLYWLAFLLSLEPGNILRAGQAGAGLTWSQETIRILGASLLGCATTPILMAQVRRFPVEGRHWRKRVMLQGLGVLALAATLIVVSCLLAGAVLAGPRRPFGLEVRGQLLANGPLVAFSIAGFIALAHAMRFFEQARLAPIRTSRPAPVYASTLQVRERGRTMLIAVADIDWVETQGNYVALHIGARAHLMRESLGRLEARLDPARFRRVHRGTLVAVDRIIAVASLGSGDARLTLRGGVELRVSRTYRDSIAALVTRDDSRFG